MTTTSFLINYVYGCSTGALKMGDCGPVWQMAVIITLLIAAIGALVVMRLAAARQLSTAS